MRKEETWFLSSCLKYKKYIYKENTQKIPYFFLKDPLCIFLLQASKQACKRDGWWGKINIEDPWTWTLIYISCVIFCRGHHIVALWALYWAGFEFLLFFVMRDISGFFNWNLCWGIFCWFVTLVRFEIFGTNNLF